MNSLIHLYVFAGLAFAFAVINIITGLQKKSDRTYLFFGLISFCIGIYYVLFPLAYHSNHPEFYDRTGLAFFIAAFGLFPWFFLYYGQCKRNNIPWILSGGMALTFLLFIFDIEGGIGRLWNIVGHIVLLGIVLYGFQAAIFIRKSGRLRSANILLLAMVIFFLLMVDDIIYVHFHSYYLFDLPQGILPFDYFFILFMIIMGSKLTGDLKQKAYLEGKNVHQQKRWQKLLEEVDLIVVELSDTGLVRYVNPYYLKLTGFNKEHVIGKNWFLEFLPEKSGREVYKVFEQNLKTDKHPNYRNTIVNSNGEEHLVAWSNVILYDDNGNPSGSISIGSDITKEEKAFQEVEELKSKLELENIILKSELYQLADQGTIIGKSDAIKYVVQRAGQVAETDTSVLLEGETGVGKEIFANYIQSNSKRNSKPFVKVNCSALPAALLESELFGHVKGAFTGAERNKKGLVELADGGTLFLDEIGEVPIELQPKLLRFL